MKSRILLHHIIIEAKSVNQVIKHLKIKIIGWEGALPMPPTMGNPDKCLVENTVRYYMSLDHLRTEYYFEFRISIMKKLPHEILFH